jgi:hypothetical protein
MGIHYFHILGHSEIFFAEVLSSSNSKKVPRDLKE